MRRSRSARSLILALVTALALSPCAVSAADVATEAGSAAASARSLESLSWIIDSFLARPHLRGAEISIIVESLDHCSLDADSLDPGSATPGALPPLYERHADRPMIPASNMKVVTAA
ncbi:hypothetical protein KAW64_15170, partial [bacterium]|nr:hypothetical protein [bacterium]